MAQRIRSHRSERTRRLCSHSTVFDSGRPTRISYAFFMSHPPDLLEAVALIIARLLKRTSLLRLQVLGL